MQKIFAIKTIIGIFRFVLAEDTKSPAYNKQHTFFFFINGEFAGFASRAISVNLAYLRCLSFITQFMWHVFPFFRRTFFFLGSWYYCTQSALQIQATFSSKKDYHFIGSSHDHVSISHSFLFFFVFWFFFVFFFCMR